MGDRSFMVTIRVDRDRWFKLKLFARANQVSMESLVDQVLKDTLRKLEAGDESPAKSEFESGVA